MANPLLKQLQKLRKLRRLFLEIICVPRIEDLMHKIGDRLAKKGFCTTEIRTHDAGEAICFEMNTAYEPVVPGDPLYSNTCACLIMMTVEIAMNRVVFTFHSHGPIGLSHTEQKRCEVRFGNAQKMMAEIRPGALGDRALVILAQNLPPPSPKHWMPAPKATP